MSADAEILEHFHGKLAVVNQDAGAQLALRAILELLERHGYADAHLIVRDFGPVAISAAFAREARGTEDIPTAGQAVPTNTSK